MRADSTIVEVMRDGSERPFPKRPMRPMTPGELRTARRMPRVKTLRRARSLSQQEFAVRYRIPLGTLRDWEQGRTEPDQPARAYLTIIALSSRAIPKACGEPVKDPARGMKRTKIISDLDEPAAP